MEQEWVRRYFQTKVMTLIQPTNREQTSHASGPVHYFFPSARYIDRIRNCVKILTCKLFKYSEGLSVDESAANFGGMKGKTS